MLIVVSWLDFLYTFLGKINPMVQFGCNTESIVEIDFFKCISGKITESWLAIILFKYSSSESHFSHVPAQGPS